MNMPKFGVDLGIFNRPRNINYKEQSITWSTKTDSCVKLITSRNF